MKKVLLLLMFIVSALVVSSCSNGSLTGQSFASPKVDLQCSGEAKAILQDNCFDEETHTLKLLVLNGDLADLKHMNINIIGSKGKDSLRFPLQIEMGENTLLNVEWPESLGTPQSAILQVFFFGNTGLENCLPLTLAMENVRICGQPPKDVPSDNEAEL